MHYDSLVTLLTFFILYIGKNKKQRVLNTIP